MLPEGVILLREPGRDVDILVKKEKLNEFLGFLKNRGYLILRRKYYHISARKIDVKGMQIFDLQFAGLSYNHIIYLSEKYFFNKRTKKAALAAGLLLHLIINKSSIKKRERELVSMLSSLSKAERKRFEEILQAEFGKTIANKLLAFLDKRNYRALEKMKWELIFKKATLLQLLKLPFVIFFNILYARKQRGKVVRIAFLGVDGSGKTTAINNLVKFFEKAGIKAKKYDLGVYHKRSLFAELLGKIYSKSLAAKKTKKEFILNYRKKSTLKNIFRIVDIYLRYRKALRDAKKHGIKVVLFDRYFYDVILQSKPDAITRIMLKLVPEPEFTFFLYAKPEVLYRRKKERPPEILEEQMRQFENEMKRIGKEFIKIKSEGKRKTLKEIISCLNNEKFLGNVA